MTISFYKSGFHKSAVFGPYFHKSTEEISNLFARDYNKSILGRSRNTFYGLDLCAGSTKRKQVLARTDIILKSSI